MAIEFNVFRFLPSNPPCFCFIFSYPLSTSNMRYTRVCVGVTLVVCLVSIHYACSRPTRSDGKVARGKSLLFLLFSHPSVTLTVIYPRANVVFHP
jgi:hypothetical protein